MSTNIAASALTGNPYAVSGHSYKYYARVKNTASSTIDSYTVSLVDADTQTVLATENATTPLAAGEEILVPLIWAPAQEGTVQLVSRVQCEGDAFSDDNEAPALAVEVLPAGSGERIALGGVTTDNLAPTTWLEQSAMTLVYDGTADFPTAATTAEIDLAAPFAYTGGHLAVLTVNSIGYGYFNGVYGLQGRVYPEHLSKGRIAPRRHGIMVSEGKKVLQ